MVVINDVVEGMIAAMSKGRRGHRYILGNERLSYKAITEIIFNVIKEKPPKHRLHKWLLYVVGLGNDALSRLIGKDMYDVSIIDEASQMILPNSIGVIRHAKSTILVGDHFQQPPIIQSDNAKALCKFWF